MAIAIVTTHHPRLPSAALAIIVLLLLHVFRSSAQTANNTRSTPVTPTSGGRLTASDIGGAVSVIAAAFDTTCNQTLQQPAGTIIRMPDNSPLQNLPCTWIVPNVGLTYLQLATVQNNAANSKNSYAQSELILRITAGNTSQLVQLPPLSSSLPSPALSSNDLIFDGRFVDDPVLVTLLCCEQSNMQLTYHTHKNRQCIGHEYSCADGSGCYDEWQRCDGVRSCTDGSDETDCVYCRDRFQCRDGVTCYNHSDICNGISDCADGGDEQNCARRLCRNVVYGADFLVCNDSTCVPKLPGLRRCPELVERQRHRHAVGTSNSARPPSKRGGNISALNWPFLIAFSTICLLILFVTLIVRWCTHRATRRHLSPDVGQRTPRPFLGPGYGADDDDPLLDSDLEAELRFGGTIFDATLQEMRSQRRQLCAEDDNDAASMMMKLSQPDWISVEDGGGANDMIAVRHGGLTILGSAAELALISLGLYANECGDLITHELHNLRRLCSGDNVAAISGGGDCYVVDISEQVCECDLQRRTRFVGDASTVTL